MVLSPGATLADLLLVAGGGGGAGDHGRDNNGGAGGELTGGSGQGGASDGYGGGGGGYSSAGQAQIQYPNTGGHGYDGGIANGGVASPAAGYGSAGGAGGAGGGGGVYFGGGGGGGYTGGLGGYLGGADGGTSYIGATFTNMIDVAGANAGNGYVTLTPIPGVPEPSTWAMLILGFAGLGLAGWRRELAAQSRATMAETRVQSR